MSGIWNKKKYAVMCLLAFLMVLYLSISIAQAYFITGGLIWSYNTGHDVESVSVSSDGSYIAAGSGYSVYFF